MSEHEWVVENLDAYVAGGLPAEEWERLEQHAAGCADCARALTQARQLEKSMAELFADARPDARMEERMIRRLRKTPLPRRWPYWTRFAIAAAAVVLLGGVGAAVQAVMMKKEFDGGPRTFVTVGNKIGAASGESDGRVQQERKETFGVVDFDPAATEFDTDIRYKNERIADVSVPGASNPTTGLAIPDGEKAPSFNLRGFGGVGQGGEIEGKKKVQESSYDQARAESELGYGFKYGGGERLQGTFHGRSGGAKESNGVAGMDDVWNESRKDGGNESKKPALGIPTSPAVALGGGSVAADAGLHKPKFKAPPDATYFIPADSLAFTPLPTPKDPKDGPPLPRAGDKEAPDGGTPKKKPDPGFDNTFAFSPQPNKQPEPPPPTDAGLKIIRTGDMEFEVDSFDNAVKAIVVLLKPLQTKGAFKLKEDSSKQANGKTRGHVVVRMPPQFLDDFVLDLRRDLGKMGDLKLQQIGSQDVTKQFTDTESELKAARAVEKRLLGIIENSKGDVKDFVAAEKELGVWRTKIEKMEGELRYYANQVALSTLTITLTEKEITAASALVVNANVRMRVEVDNVTRARETVEKAVEELKGRIVKSDEKQHPAGQVEAIVHADIPPANKDAFRKVLYQLGIVSAHEDTQSQTTEGGTGPVLTPKRRLNDVRFELSLYNIVNIQPKHSIKLDVVTTDVRSNFEKLKDEIVRVHKGQMREAKLNENQDKQKSIAVMRFNVPSEKKPAVDKLIADIGPTLDRANMQADIKDVSTDQTFGYDLTLYSIATIDPREKVRLHVEVKDVEKELAEITAIVKDSSGQMAKPKSGLNQKGQTEALLVITVPLKFSDRCVKQIKDTGKVIDWVQTPNTQVPDNDLATTQVVVLLTGPNPIIPNDEGLGTYATKGLYISFTVLVYCLIAILTGICILAPWALVLLAGVWIYRRFVPKTTPAPRIAASAVTPTPTPPEPPKS